MADVGFRIYDLPGANCLLPFDPAAYHQLLVFYLPLTRPGCCFKKSSHPFSFPVDFIAGPDV